MKIAICDDRVEQIEIIKVATEKFFSDFKELEYTLQSFTKAFDFLDAQEKNTYDLALLDICMPGLLGIDVAKEIRKNKANTEIVFLTTSDEFAVEAFALKAAHYLLKPFSQAEFNEAMLRAIQKMSKRETKRIVFSTDCGELTNVDLEKIEYIESHDHNLTIFLSNGQKIETRETLAQIFDKLQKLSKGQFILPYKGYIINQKFIETLGTSKILLRNGQEIPIPRGMSRKLQSQYLAYCFEKSEE